MLPGALGPDLGKQERTASSQTAAGIPTSQQRDRDGPHRWTGVGGGADADAALKECRHHRPHGGVTELHKVGMVIERSLTGPLFYCLARSAFMRSVHNGQNPVPETRMGGSDQSQ